MSEKQFYDVKNKATGKIFNLSKEICDRLVKEEPYNFEVIDKDYVPPKTENKEETTTYNKVVVEPGEQTGENEAPDYEKMTVAQLTELCEAKKIEIPKKAKKADVIKLLEEYKEPEQTGENEETGTPEE